MIRFLHTYFLLILCTSTMISCDFDEDSKEIVKDKGEIESIGNDPKYHFDSKPERRSESRLSFNEVGYTIKYVSALDFLKRKGTEVEKEDISSLEKETVLMIEFTSLNEGKRSLFDLAQCKYEKSKAIESLAFQLEKNIVITQNDSIYNPNGLHFERDFGVSDRLRAVAFFKNIDASESFKVLMEDQIFGAGSLTFVLNKNKLS